MPTSKPPSSTSLPVEDPDHEIMKLPKEVWQDESNPVAQTARKYEQTLSSINSALEPLPIPRRLMGYVAGAVVGSLPALAISYAVGKNVKGIDPHALETATHLGLTWGVITGTHTAHELMMQPQIYMQEERTAKLLTEARKQVRTSYADSIKGEREAATSTNMPILS
jgi:hypothetical protein